MNTIIDCEVDKIYKVKKLHTSGFLRQRLVSFGILKGVEIKHLAHTNLKGTYNIEIGKMSVVLRKNEAEMIEVV
ncbi:MAG: ferrous iron transport protein A [Sulfurimonas sp.]|jgi:ferrous iron transport protein A